MDLHYICMDYDITYMLHVINWKRFTLYLHGLYIQ